MGWKINERLCKAFFKSAQEVVLTVNDKSLLCVGTSCPEIQILHLPAYHCSHNLMLWGVNMSTGPLSSAEYVRRFYPKRKQMFLAFILPPFIGLPFIHEIFSTASMNGAEKDRHSQHS